MNELKENIMDEIKELNESYDYYLEKYDDDGILSVYDKERMIEIRSEIRTYEKVLKMIEGDSNDWFMVRNRINTFIYVYNMGMVNDKGWMIMDLEREIINQAFQKSDDTEYHKRKIDSNLIKANTKLVDENKWLREDNEKLLNLLNNILERLLKYNDDESNYYVPVNEIIELIKENV